MKAIADKILQEIESIKPRLLTISPEKARIKPDAENWSQQEVLGHLIDSALCNHQRFVRGHITRLKNSPV